MRESHRRPAAARPQRVGRHLGRSERRRRRQSARCAFAAGTQRHQPLVTIVGGHPRLPLRATWRPTADQRRSQQRCFSRSPGISARSPFSECPTPLPISTPSNAIAFASGELTVLEMLKAGLLVTVLGLVLAFTTGYAWWGLVGLF
ncbi:MAG: anion permease [Planctomycetaceae bacterium]|nr:anion permease [Planctomycetaceae bacterium]